ncbi:hypothetical protein AWC35_04310 [Gibbsiella quercinecans]|uniref:Uncharacterized protein n=1 Tax=Gibbsiella quercinecans TaxID=929813 RepID=A0A250AXN0_9GAMM|nr:hypothetical protein AWC35_04310 [Gibbsiella quercinecans]RLM14879.1 hypothetical protein BIY30_00070 [Gibbsiella quercinecans]
MGVLNALIPAFSQGEKGRRVWHGSAECHHSGLLSRGEGAQGLAWKCRIPSSRPSPRGKRGAGSDMGVLVLKALIPALVGLVRY